MFIPAHLAAGLIIGKISNDYPTAIIVSLAIDLDHLVSYFKNKILFSPKKFWKIITDQKDPYGNQRNILHNLLVWLIVSLLTILINLNIGLVLSLAYLSHLFLDALDNADYYLFYPSKKITIRGPIPYMSRKEFLLTIVLFAFFLII